MKKLLILLTAAAFSGCATHQPACVLLKFPSAPSPALSAQLAATQRDTTAAEVAQWFATGHHGFILADTHTNEIAAALGEGASARVIHGRSSYFPEPIGWMSKL